MMQLRTALWVGITCLSIVLPGAVQAQAPVPLAVQDTILDYGRPRIAVAQDGSYAVAFEALVQASGSSFSNWQIAVQRYSAAGAPVGPTHLFDGESCSGLDLWLSDIMEHAELAFRSDGILLVLMQHSGEYVIGSDGVQSAEVTLAAVDQNGQVIDLNNSGSCLQQKLIFVGGHRQDRPRMALTPDDAVLVTLDGFLDDAPWRNVGIRILNANLEEIEGLDQLIPHDDPGSQQAIHWYPDIATNGARIASVWMRCPVLDNQGSFNECDVEAQFVEITQQEQLQNIGGNRVVNAGDPPGTYSIWPVVAMDAAGNSVVAWADSRASADGEVFAQRFDASGQPVGGNVQVSTGLGEIYGPPEVAMLPDGRFMVAWFDSAAVGFSARGRRYDAGGTPQEEPFLLAGGATVQTGQPSLATSGNDFLYTWLGGQQDATAVYSSNRGLVSADEPAGEVPRTPSLAQNYPNPFNPSTTIRFELAAPAVVELAVYDVLGRRVAVLAGGLRNAGTHTVVFDATGMPDGLYLYRLASGTFTQSRTMMLIQ